MKTGALKKFRARLSADEPVYGLWVTLESASITEMATALGLDWVVIDAEHGHLDWKEILEHVRAAVRSETVVLVRVAESNGGLIKRALDIGADGVVVPWIESADELRRAASYALYPPQGVRGIGAERATAWGQCFAEHTAEANENVLIVPIVETVPRWPQDPRAIRRRRRGSVFSRARRLLGHRRISGPMGRARRRRRIAFDQRHDSPGRQALRNHRHRQ